MAAAAANTSTWSNVLDFGAQDTTSQGPGTQTAFGGAYPTDAQIETIADWFAQGFYGGTGADTKTVDLIIIGTNNSLTPTSAQGSNWANVAGIATQDAVSGGYDSQEVFESGIDAETWAGTPSNQQPGATTTWLNAYSNSSPPGYDIDYGSADGCPLSGGVQTYCDTCNNNQCNTSWYVSNYQYDAWGNSLAFGAPEIAGFANAQQWANISAYSASVGQGKIWYPGPMSESYVPGYVSASGAFSDLNTALSQANVPESNMTGDTDMQNPQTTSA